MPEQDAYPRVYLYRRLVQAKLFIDVHYEQALVLGDIAGEAFFSKFHFIRLFKKSYGKTPHQYLTHVRIEKAKHFLKNGFSVNEVCFMVGFDSPTSFAGLFKKLTRYTPSAYQSLQHETKTGIQREPLNYVPGCFAKMKGWNKKSNFGEVL